MEKALNTMEETTIVPVVTNTVPSVINWNYEQIKNTLSEFLVKYESYQVCEDTLPEDKKTRAELNKVSKSIDDFRKTIKKEISKPIDVFEDQCKELAGMVIDVSSKIDQTVKEFEDKKKEEKRKLAQAIIDDLKGQSGLPEKYASRIELKENYTNLSISKTQVETDVNNQITALQAEHDQDQQNVEVIKSTLESANKRIKSQLFLEDYISMLQFRQLGEVIALINRRTEAIIEQENAVPEPKAEPVVVPKVAEVKTVEEKTTIAIQITATKTELRALKEFFTINKIDYIKLD